MKDNSNIENRFQIPIKHTKPKTPFIVAIATGSHIMMGGNEITKQISKILLINRGIFLKSEYAKSSFHIIEECYNKYARKLDDGKIVVNPSEFYPAMKEVDSLLFELSSILDFFARQINYAFHLKIRFDKISFGSVVHSLRSNHPKLEITKKVIEFDDSEIHNYFRKMRNMITHRLPFQVKGRGIQLFFPDDPERDELDPTTDNEIDVYETCKVWLHEILAFVDKTSVYVFQKASKLEIKNKKTGKKLSVDEFYEFINTIEES